MGCNGVAKGMHEIHESPDRPRLLFAGWRGAGAHRLRTGLRERGIEARIFAARTGTNDITDYLCAGTKGPLRTLLQTANLSALVELRRVRLRTTRP